LASFGTWLCGARRRVAGSEEEEIGIPIFILMNFILRHVACHSKLHVRMFHVISPTLAAPHKSLNEKVLFVEPFTSRSSQELAVAAIVLAVVASFLHLL